MEQERKDKRLEALAEIKELLSAIAEVDREWFDADIAEILYYE